MQTAILKFAQLFDIAKWTEEHLDEMTLHIVSTLGDAIGAELEPLDYTGVDNPENQRTGDSLWLRFRSKGFADPSNFCELGGAVYASRNEEKVSGFIQYFINGVPVRALEQSCDMLSMDFRISGKSSKWELQWEPHDFAEEYDQYTYIYFKSLAKLSVESTG